ncbi:MAG: undecaprenyl-phosphate glucose phosphotransferase [Rhodocyclaceae bacterium]
MLAAANPRHSLLKARPSLVSVIGSLLDPLVAIAALAAVNAWYAEPFDAPYFILTLVVFSMAYPGKPQLGTPSAKMARDVLFDWTILAGVLFLFGYASGYLAMFPERVLVAWFVAVPIAQIACQQLVRLVLPHVLGRRENYRRAVIVGANETGLALARNLARAPWLGIRLAGFFDDRTRCRIEAPEPRPRLLGRTKDLSAYVRGNGIDLIYLALPMATQPRILALLDELADTTASVYFVPDVFVTDLIQARMDSVMGMPVVAVCETPFTGLNGLIKRGSDLVLASLILVLVSPLMLALAIGVKLSSPGPVFFRQRRYGLDGKEIVVYKFRSMTVCEDGPEVPQATRDDARVTPFGAFMRRTSLDELPQFINVLQGRMSIVGPRPHAVAHNELYRKLIKGYMVRHKVKPGITGLAQVKGLRGETPTVEKMRARIDWDLNYVRNWSLKLDLRIILKTIWIILKGDRHAY